MNVIPSPGLYLNTAAETANLCETCQAAPRGIDGRHCQPCVEAYLAGLAAAVVEFERLDARAHAIADAIDYVQTHPDPGPYCCGWCGAALSDADFGRPGDGAGGMLCYGCARLRAG